MSTTGSKAGKRITLAADTYTDITTEFEAIGDSVYVNTDLTDTELGLVPNGETPTALPDIGAKGAVRVSKSHESTLDVWAYSTAGGDIWLTVADVRVIDDDTGTVGVTSS